LPKKTYDIAIVGGGIVGLASAMALTQRFPGSSLLLLEKESLLAGHQTGHNSGVIHAGLYYKPGSLKARYCTEGRKALYDFCTENQIAFERCGKLVVAATDKELSALDELERRGQANGLAGMQRLDKRGILEREPHACGVAGLFVPQTGIVDYVAVTEAMATIVRKRGGRIQLNAELKKVDRQAGTFLLTTPAKSFCCRTLVNCTGLQSDRVARLSGMEPGVRIIPFRGEYYKLKPERRELVRNLIYPVPDPDMPFLGVHFTRMINGDVEAGPNAVLAWKREGYRLLDVSAGDLLDSLSFPGFWKMAGRFWLTGLHEYERSLCKGAFVRSLQKLLPEIRSSDLVRAESGVRAQAVDGSGKLLDDFHLLQGEGMVHVVNAPSPAATASIAIGREIAEKVVAIS
jgi:L-2-hydroxyglutarate oxidase